MKILKLEKIDWLFICFKTYTRDVVAKFLHLFDDVLSKSHVRNVVIVLFWVPQSFRISYRTIQRKEEIIFVYKIFEYTGRLSSIIKQYIKMYFFVEQPWSYLYWEQFPCKLVLQVVRSNATLCRLNDDWCEVNRRYSRADQHDWQTPRTKINEQRRPQPLPLQGRNSFSPWVFSSVHIIFPFIPLSWQQSKHIFKTFK